MIVTYKKESTRKDTIMSKIDELIELLKFNKGEAMRREKKNNIVTCVLAVLAVLAIIAGSAYAVYRYLKPCYLEDFDDDFEDDFDDDFFEDEEEDDIPIPVPCEAPTAKDDAE